MYRTVAIVIVAATIVFHGSATIVASAQQQQLAATSISSEYLSTILKSPRSHEVDLINTIGSILRAISENWPETVLIASDRKWTYNKALNAAMSQFGQDVPKILAKNVNEQLRDYVQVKIYASASEPQLNDEEMESLYFGNTKRRSLKVILLQKSTDNHIYAQMMMQKTFQLFFQHNIVNVIILQRICGTLGLYSYEPFAKGQCHSANPILLRTFNSTFQSIHYHEIFGQKIENLHGCPLKVATWHTPPFVDITWDIRSGVKLFTGSDIVLLELLAKHLNFTLDIQEIDASFYSGGWILDNGSLLGFFDLLEKRMFHIAIGNKKCMLFGSQHFTASHPYFHMQNIVVLKALQHYPRSQILLFPFSTRLWILIAVIWFIKFSAKVFLKIYSKKLRSPFSTFCLLTWLIFIGVLLIAYESSTFMFVQSSPRKPLPLTLSEMFDQKYSLITDFNTYQTHSYIPELRKHATMIPMSPWELINSFDSYPPNVAIITTNGIMNHYMKTASPHYKTKKLYDIHHHYAVSNEQLCFHISCIYYQRASYLVNAIDDLILRLRSIGFFLKASNEVIPREFTPYSASFFNQHAFLGEPKAGENMLVLRQSFLSLSLLNSVSLIVFILECLSRKVRCLKWILNKLH